jgi:D-glycero-alpha-D-manno-heptose-7-phosphate kinase
MEDTTPIVSLAPLRISFVGGGTDFPHWFRDHHGAVLSATIDHFVKVEIVPRSDRQVRVRSVDLGHLVEYHLDEGPTYDGVMDLAKAAIDRVGCSAGIDVAIESEAPAGSGLGGSSAQVTAVVAGLSMLGEISCTADDLARLAYRIEREDLRISGGWQDQYAAAFGGINLIEFSTSGVSVTPIRLSPGAAEKLASGLLLCYSGSVRRSVGLIDTQIELFERGREETLLGMKQLAEMAYPMRDALVEGDVETLGAMLAEAFEAKRRMNPHIAENTRIEAMLEAARGAGAWGGKICGAGGGGYLLVACPSDRRPAVRAALEALGGQIAPFEFHAEGVRAKRGDAVWAPLT